MSTLPDMPDFEFEDVVLPKPNQYDLIFKQKLNNKAIQSIQLYFSK